MNTISRSHHMKLEEKIKFQLNFIESDEIHPSWIKQINAWRLVHHRLNPVNEISELQNQTEQGTISTRVPGEPDHFIMADISQPRQSSSSNKDFSLITSINFEHNTISALGNTQPSNVAALHGWLYQQSSDINAVIHLRSPEIISRVHELKIPKIEELSTPNLFDGIEQLFTHSNLARKRIFQLSESDGALVGFGRNIFEASLVFIDHFVRALELE